MANLPLLLTGPRNALPEDVFDKQWLLSNYKLAAIIVTRPSSPSVSCDCFFLSLQVINTSAKFLPYRDREAFWALATYYYLPSHKFCALLSQFAQRFEQVGVYPTKTHTLLRYQNSVSGCKMLWPAAFVILLSRFLYSHCIESGPVLLLRTGKESLCLPDHHLFIIFGCGWGQKGVTCTFWGARVCEKAIDRSIETPNSGDVAGGNIPCGPLAVVSDISWFLTSWT